MSATMRVAAILALAVVFSALAGAAGEAEYRDINGARLFVKSIGAGPAIVLVHGGPGFNHRYFLPHVERLVDEGFRLVLFDLRGHGRSLGGVTAESLSFDAFVEDLEALRAELGLERMNLLAHSWGALAGMEYAIRHPERLESLVLVSPVAAKRGEFDAETRARQEAQRDKADAARVKELTASDGFKARDPAVVEDFFKILWRNAFFHREALANLHLDLGETYPESSRLLESLYRDPKLADYDFYPRLTAVKAPSLVVHGAYDTIPVAAAEQIHAHLPGSRLVSLADCGHFPFVDCPEPFFDSLLSFLREGRPGQ